MTWDFAWDDLRLIEVDENGEMVEDSMDSRQISDQINQYTEILSSIQQRSLISLRMDSRKETVLAMLALFRRGTPFIVVGSAHISASRWSLENRRVLVEHPNAPIDTLPEGIVYSIFTSGTTGERKRVDVPEDCIRINIEDFRDRFRIGDRILQCTSFHFDPSMVDILLWAMIGNTLLLMREEAARTPAALPLAIVQCSPTFVQMCPSMLIRLGETTLRKVLSTKTSLQTLLIGGEQFPLDLIQRCRSIDCPTEIFDVYGITEVSCWATVRKITKVCKMVTLGEEIKGTLLRIDEANQLWIGGEKRRCLVDGTSHEWSNTGDKVVKSSDGVRIVGRSGDEIKINGIRVNLAECARDLARVEPSLEFARFHYYKDTFLVLFVMGDAVLDMKKVESILPFGIHVHHLELISTLPLNTSGKADMAALMAQLENNVAMVSESKLYAELAKFGLDSLQDIDMSLTLAQLGLDSAAMLRLAYVLHDDVCYKLIVAGDVTLNDLVQAVRMRSTNMISIDKDVEKLDSIETMTEHSELWSMPMEKCVDAQPLIIQKSDGTIRIAIGSHSGLFVCLSCPSDYSSYTVLWQQWLRHRVLSSARIIQGAENADCVAVCTYNGDVNIFNENNGDLYWRYECRSTIRSDLISGDSSTLFVCDYGGHVHKLNVEQKKLMWKTLVRGHIRAAPTLIQSGTVIATVSLSGSVTGVYTDSGVVYWKDKSGRRPIFASLIEFPDGRLATVDVDGTIDERTPAAVTVALSPEQLGRAESHVDEATYTRLKQISADSFARCIQQGTVRVKQEPGVAHMTVGAMLTAHHLSGTLGGALAGATGPPPPTPIGAPSTPSPAVLDITSPKDSRFFMDEGRREHVQVIRCSDLSNLADSGKKERQRAAGEDWKKYDQELLNSFLSVHHRKQELAEGPKMGVEDKRTMDTIHMYDRRICVLCGLTGDGDRQTNCGRLLNYDSCAWVHANCALWSCEVYETPSGGLVNVDRAVIRGVVSLCNLCGRSGATVQCFKVECLRNFHFTCANRMFGQKFLKDKNFICPNHNDVHMDALATLEPLRRLYVHRDENKLLAKLFESSDVPRIVLRLGALTFYRLGQLLPEQLKTCHNERFIFPIGYTVQRAFWSPSDVKRRLRYSLTITATANDAWKQVFDAVARVRDRRGDVLRFVTNQLDGESLYGLEESVVTKITESLPGVDSLYSYTFRHGGTAVLELPLAENPSGCARCEPRLRTLIKHRKVAPSAAPSGGKQRHQNLYEELQMQMRMSGWRTDGFGVPGGNKWDQYGSTEQSYSGYQKMRKEWRNTVYLARSKIQGLGLYAKRDIDMGAMIIEYKGEVIRAEVCEMREKKYFAQNRGTYMFRASDECIIDATMKGGPARYINHSCDPNCATHIMHLGANGEDKKIIITANRPIKADEELTYDYQFDIEDDSEKVACLCGAPNWQRWMN